MLMTNNIRVFLWLGLARAQYQNNPQWQVDDGPNPGPTTTQNAKCSVTVQATTAATFPQAPQPAHAP